MEDALFTPMKCTYCYNNNNNNRDVNDRQGGIFHRSNDRSVLLWSFSFVQPDNQLPRCSLYNGTGSIFSEEDKYAEERRNETIDSHKHIHADKF